VKKSEIRFYEDKLICFCCLKRKLAPPEDALLIGSPPSPLSLSAGSSKDLPTLSATPTPSDLSPSPLSLGIKDEKHDPASPRTAAPVHSPNALAVKSAKLLKHWVKGDLIGKGQFGKVYVALLPNGQWIAVKQLEFKTDEDSEHIKFVEQEVSLMEKLKHENIVQLLGMERAGPYINIFMEYVPGKSLDVHLKSFGAFPELTIKWYTLQLCRALEYMHDKAMVHRDLKGKNILVDTNGLLKLADFGSAKQFESRDKNESPSDGYNYTPLWTAPEVIAEGSYNRKVDVWSLGCVMIEMATAKLPWSECNFENPFRALFHIGNSGEIPAIPSHLSPSCQAFMRRCLSRDPELRPDAADLLKDPFLESLGPEEDQAEYAEAGMSDGAQQLSLS